MGAMYLVTSPSGKQYVGITTHTVEKRWDEHVKFSKSIRGRHAITAAIRKYGADKMVVKPIVIADNWNYLCILEKRAIKVFGTLGPDGYNQTSGGDGAVGFDPATKERHRTRTSIATKAAWNSGTLRENRARVWASDDFKEKHRKATQIGVKTMYADPIMREKTLTALKSESKREANRKAALAQWADPEKRAIALEAAKRKVPQTPEQRKKQGESLRKTIAARKSVGTYWVSGRTDSAETKALKVAAIKSAWADPVKREARIAAIKLAWKRKEEQQNG